MSYPQKLTPYQGSFSSDVQKFRLPEIKVKSMSEILFAIISVNDETTFIVAGLSIVCAFLMHQMTDSRVLTLIFAPIAAFGALLGIFICHELNLVFSTYELANIILMSLFGMIFGLLFQIVSYRLFCLFLGAIRGNRADKLHQTRA